MNENDYKLRKLLILGRYGERRHLQEIKPNVFKLTGEDLDYMRVIFTEDGKDIFAIDPTGGPFIHTGSFIKKGIYIKSIVLDKETNEFLIYTRE